mgnify:CR=1 FL=1
MRPLRMMSNDTVYLMRFAGPLWCEDGVAVGVGAGGVKVRRGVWQLVELHLSQVVELMKELREQYPSI